MIVERRKFLGSIGKTALAVAGGFVVAVATNVARAAEDEEGEGDIGAVEDLMREHGVLRRVLLIYEEGLRRIAAHQDFPGNPFLTGAQLIRNFIEDYHEKNEERFIEGCGVGVFAYVMADKAGSAGEEDFHLASLMATQAPSSATGRRTPT